jgi:hypothetical protein
VTEQGLAEQLAQVPPLAGIVDEVVAGIYEAFSLAIGDTFWIGLFVSLIALAVVGIGLADRPIRHLGEVAPEERAEPQASPPALA